MSEQLNPALVNALKGLADAPAVGPAATPSAELIPEVTKFAGDVNVLVKAIHQRIVDTQVALQDSIAQMEAEIARRKELLDMLKTQRVNLQDDLYALRDIEKHAHEALLRQVV